MKVSDLVHPIIERDRLAQAHASLQSLGIPEEGYLMIVVYHPDGRPLEGYPTFARVGDIGHNDQALIAVGFRGSAAGFPYLSYHEFSEAIPDLFDTIKPRACLPSPDNPFVVYGVVEVRLWKDTQPNSILNQIELG